MDKQREKRVYLFFPDKARKEEDVGMEVIMMSRNTAELEDEFRKLKLGLEAVKREIFKVGKPLADHLN